MSYQQKIVGCNVYLARPVALSYACIFIARQHAMHADRDIDMANLSVRLSLCHTLVLYLNDCIPCQTLSTSGRGMTLLFVRYCRYKIPRRTPSARALNA